MVKKIEMTLALLVFRFMYCSAVLISLLWIFFYVYDTSHGLR